MGIEVVSSNPMQSKEKRNRLLGLILRKWRRPRQAVPRTKSLTTSCTMMPLIKLRRCHSWPDSDWDDMAPGAVAPDGYFAVYVGPDRARFVIKTESVNHPLFRMLLEEAEKEYGFDFAGPLTLPCEVAVFRSILGALNSTDYDRSHENSLHGEDARLGLLSPRAMAISTA
jgi:SAUR family protein